MNQQYNIWKQMFAIISLMMMVEGSVKMNPIVRTTSGTLVGETIQLANGDRVNRFLGVPYAMPPLGSNRFEKPIPVTNQTDSIVYAQQSMPMCVQMRHMWKTISPLLDVDRNHNISEDCLYLNIYIPANAKQSNLPVMVWLPGEGFDFADARQFNGAYLASMGQVIVITVQYRVGVFGFLKPNLGLWDQVVALQWIRSNVAELGGDESNVTLFGRFSGSMSISILMASPIAIQSPTPLFNRAILMSGIAVGNWVFDKRHDDKVRQVMTDVGCTSFECLRSLPMERLVAASGYGWKPTIDRELITDEPMNALSNGHFPKYVNSVMLGTNQFEGNLCLLKHLVVDRSFYSKLVHNNVSTSEYEKAIREDLQMFYGDDGEVLGKRDQQQRYSLITDRSMYVEFCSELLINSHMRQYKDLLSNVARSDEYQLMDVVNYKLDYRPSFSIAPKFINSSIHGDDVILAFGLAFTNQSERRISADDQTMSRMMVNLFSNFARNGAQLDDDSVEIRLHQQSAIDSMSMFSMKMTQHLAFTFACGIMMMVMVALIILVLRQRTNISYMKHQIES